MKIRAIVTAVLLAVAPPALAEISDYESMRSRLTDVLGSQAEADAAYNKLMQEANALVDLFIQLCTVSDECEP